MLAPGVDVLASGVDMLASGVDMSAAGVAWLARGAHRVGNWRRVDDPADPRHPS
jgi:hypothetical protein